jgi:hypothetical protein
MIYLMKKNRADIDLGTNGILGTWRIKRNRVIITGIYNSYNSYNFTCSKDGASLKEFNQCKRNIIIKMKNEYGKKIIPVKVKLVLKPLRNSKVLVTGFGKDNNPVAGKKVFTFTIKETFSCNGSIN